MSATIEFARKFGLEIRRVVAPRVEDADAPMDEAFIPHTGGEVLVNSGPYTGLPADEGGKAILGELEARGEGAAAVTYRLRDWLISRQRYWGTPIPIIYCERDGTVPVPEEELPVRLPDTVDYRGSGENPLNRDEAFLNVTCPVCGGPAKRETDTMDTFIDSSWYWYRYLSPEKRGGPIDRALVDAWTPVDQYTGGAEHAVMHLLYAREWTKMMRDIGRGRPGRAVQAAVQPGADPRPRRRAHVEVAWQYRRPRRPRGPLRRGHGQAVPDVHGAVGPGRAVEPDRDRWRAPLPATGCGLWPSIRTAASPATPKRAVSPAGETEAEAASALRVAAHRTLRDVTTDYEAFRFNTMIAKLMELSNTLFRYRGTSVAGSPAWDEAIRVLLLMLAPAAPHITEELWSRRLAASGAAWSSIHTETWPIVDAAAVVESTREIPVQVNGKLRDKVTVPADATTADIEAAVLGSRADPADPRRPEPERVVVAGGGKLVNLVVR